MPPTMTVGETPSTRYKESGNKFFSMKNYKAAMACYRRGIEELPSHDGPAAPDDTNDESVDLEALEVALRGNLALVLLKLDSVDSSNSTSSSSNSSNIRDSTSKDHLNECIKECSQALQLDSDNAKIIYRRGQARQILATEWNEIDEWIGAEEDFTKCIRILEDQLKKEGGSNAAITQQISDAKKALEKLIASKKDGPKPAPYPTPTLQPNKEHFPWDVPTLLKHASKPEPLPMGGCIVRSALTPTQQRILYQMLYDNLDRSSQEFHSLELTRSVEDHHKLNPDNRPQPLVTWVHPYTRLSNALERPTKLLQWAEELMHALAPESANQEVDSMLAQLYAPGGSLLKHRDEDLSWGVGVSLGSEAQFDCLPDNGETNASVTIRSGDILVGEFGKMPHAVAVRQNGHNGQNDPPSWWGEVDHFGSKMRCNVLFRKALTAKRQRKLAEERARKVYGIGLKELKERTGRDESFLSVHLRHLALE